MKKLLLISLLNIFVVACSQENRKNNTINSQNFVEKVLENVNHYDYEPKILLLNLSQY